MPTFSRGQYTELGITLRSDETLGILDSSYVEDYFGVDGQISLLHTSGIRYTVLMNPVPEETPAISNDVFVGFIDLSTIPNGTFTVQGRVRDIANSYTILNEVETPFGDERIINLTFDVIDGEPSNIVVDVGPLRLSGAIAMELQLMSEIDLAGPIVTSPSLVATFANDITLSSPEQSAPTVQTKLQDGPLFIMPLKGELNG
jgi:hypothetical protein